MIQSVTNKAFQLTEVTKRFQDEHPDVPIIKATATKLIQVDLEDLTTLKRGEHWVHSIRGAIIITPNTLFCYTSPRFEAIHTPASQIEEFKDIVIPYETIRQAFLIKIKYGGVLALRLIDDTCYQFGLNYDRELKQLLPFQFETINTKVGWTAYSIKARLRCSFYLIALILLIAVIIALS